MSDSPEHGMPSGTSNAELARQIAEAQQRRDGVGVPADNTPARAAAAGMEMAWRFVVDLVVGTGIGAGLGFALDKWLGTLPLGTVSLGLVGFAAGVRLVMRQAQKYAAANPPPPGSTLPPSSESDDGEVR